MISLVLGSIGLLVAAVIVWLVRRDQLHVNYGLGWLLVAAAFALLGFAPSVIDQLAVRLGIAYPPTLAMMLAITLLVLKILLMDIERSQLRMRNHRLTQRLAMLEARLDDGPRPSEAHATTNDGSTESGAKAGSDDQH